MTSVQAIMLFDAHQLADFVQQFPCPTCQHSGYDATGSTMGLANIVLLKCVFKWQILALEDTIHMDTAFSLTWTLVAWVHSIGRKKDMPTSLEYNSFSASHGSNSCKTDYDWINQRVVLVTNSWLWQCSHVMKPNKDVALLARMVWQLYLQGTQMVLQMLYMLSCRYS